MKMQNINQRTTRARRQRKAHHGQPTTQSGTVLNIAPIQFSKSIIRIGELPYTEHAELRRLRRKYDTTHALRRDGRSNKIVNIGLQSDIEPLGTVREVPVQKQLYLLSAAVQSSLLLWLNSGELRITRRRQPLTFWGTKDLLLSEAIEKMRMQRTKSLEVVVRFSLDTRILYPASGRPVYLGLLIDVNTSNVIDVPVSSLIERGLNVKGLYVCRRRPEHEDGIVNALETVGRVRSVEGSMLHLADSRELESVDASEVLLEPRQENLERVVCIYYPRRAKAIIRRLSELRTQYLTGPGKLSHIRETLQKLQRNSCRFQLGGALDVDFQALLDRSSPFFPSFLPTKRPNMLFGSQGRKISRRPDDGIREFGPYKHMFHERNDVSIGVVCEAAHRGRVEQFLGMLKDGFPEPQWRSLGRFPKDKPNPYGAGLIGKFRLLRIRFEYEEINDTSAESYEKAIKRLLDRPVAPSLGIVQTRESFHLLPNQQNPYLVSKVAFMKAGIPVQVVKIETIEKQISEIPWTINNIGLASYAKIGGTPWVISTRGPGSHELVIGIGYSEVRQSRLGERQRYVGLTTVFLGDGEYLLWDQTREVEFDEYQSALLETLRGTIQYVRAEKNWQPGDHVRLVFHVYKPLKHKEIESIRELVSGMIDERYRVRFAFLDISSYHGYRLFSPSRKGKSYRTGSGHWRKKGAGVSPRGECWQLSRWHALLQLAGPADVKTEEQGCPRPLLIELHKKSDFTDLTYLARQVFHFSFMSWRSFFPGTEPVTISYSRRIARMLGQLRTIPGWDSSALQSPSLKSSKWFL